MKKGTKKAFPSILWRVKERQLTLFKCRYFVPQFYHRYIKMEMRKIKMNEIEMINGNEEVLTRSSNSLEKVMTSLNDVIDTLEALDMPHSRVIKSSIESAVDSLSKINYDMMRHLPEFNRDEKNEYLDNLRGYFNEDNGTWYEQAIASYKRLTGMGANKWTVLTWTTNLMNGYSTFDYLVHTNVIKMNGNKWVFTTSFEDMEKFGYNMERIHELVETNAADLFAHLEVPPIENFAEEKEELEAVGRVN